MPITTAAQIEHCNATGRQPVVFIHGLWLLASSWERWTTVFEEAGYAALAPGWPDDPETVAEPTRIRRSLRARRWAGSQTTSRRSSEGSSASRRSSGTPSAACWRRYLAGRGLSRRLGRDRPGTVSAACCRSRSRCCARLLPVLRNPLNYRRAVALTYDQFRYAFANAVSEDEAQGAVPSVRRPGAGRSALPGGDRERQPVSAETKVDRANPDRGPLLIARGRARTTPWHRADPACLVQEAAPQLRRHRVRRARGPRALADDRQRLARDRRHGARVRPALRASLTDLRLLHLLARRRGNGVAATGRGAAQDPSHASGRVPVRCSASSAAAGSPAALSCAARRSDADSRARWRTARAWKRSSDAGGVASAKRLPESWTSRA